MGGYMELGIQNRLLQQGETHLLQIKGHLLPKLPQQCLLEAFAPIELATGHAPGAAPLGRAHDQHLGIGVHHQGPNGAKGAGRGKGLIQALIWPTARMAAAAASSISPSLPARVRRPNAPTALTSTTVILEAFSASLAAIKT